MNKLSFTRNGEKVEHPIFAGIIIVSQMVINGLMNAVIVFLLYNVILTNVFELKPITFQQSFLLVVVKTLIKEDFGFKIDLM